MGTKLENAQELIQKIVTDLEVETNKRINVTEYNGDIIVNNEEKEGTKIILIYTNSDNDINN